MSHRLLPASRQNPLQRLPLTALACLLAMGLTACSVYKPDVAQGNIVTSEQVAVLKVGMTRQQVQQTLGSPLLQDVFNTNRWDYVYRTLKSNGALEQRVLTLMFSADGKLLSWAGQEAPEQNTISIKRPAAITLAENRIEPVSNTVPTEKLSDQVLSLATQTQVLTVAAATAAVEVAAAPAFAAPAAAMPVAAAVTAVATPTLSAPVAAAPSLLKNELLTADVSLIIVKRVASWSGAWMSKDVAGYAAHYVDGYKGDFATPAAWLAQRQRVFDSAGPINVSLTDIRVIQTSTNEARATFVQDYQSSKLKEVGNKNLFFQRTGDDWKIVGERFVKQV